MLNHVVDRADYIILAVLLDQMIFSILDLQTTCDVLIWSLASSRRKNYLLY